MVKTKTVRLPLTVLHEGEYREPGAPIAYDDIPRENVSPKQREADLQSVATLNVFHKQFVK